MFDQQPREFNPMLKVGALEETITVSASSPAVDSRAPQFVAPSNNVVNLQRRVAGVLPIRIEVPRAGTSYQFVRPLVVDGETTVTMKYKRR
jgi:hypothetical protein